MARSSENPGCKVLASSTSNDTNHLYRKHRDESPHIIFTLHQVRLPACTWRLLIQNDGHQLAQNLIRVGLSFFRKTLAGRLSGVFNEDNACGTVAASVSIILDEQAPSASRQPNLVQSENNVRGFISMFPVWMVCLVRRWKCQNLTTLIFRRPCPVFCTRKKTATFKNGMPV